MNKLRFVFSTLLVLLLTIPSLAAAADSKITAVTVYGDRAVVTRSMSSDFGVGEHAITFENLPAALLDESVQASGKGVNGATILDVSLKAGEKREFTLKLSVEHSGDITVTGLE